MHGKLFFPLTKKLVVTSDRISTWSSEYKERKKTTSIIIGIFDALLTPKLRENMTTHCANYNFFMSHGSIARHFVKYACQETQLLFIFIPLWSCYKFHLPSTHYWYAYYSMKVINLIGYILKRLFRSMLVYECGLELVKIFVLTSITWMTSWILCRSQWFWPQTRSWDQDYTVR